jgi:hypothetical protein
MGRAMTEPDAFKREIDELLQNFGHRAHANGRTIEEEIEALTSGKKPLTPEERAAVSAYFLSRYSEVQPSMTLDEIREGLM